MPHEFDAVIAGELGCEVRRAIVRALAPVLKEGELAVAVHIAESVAIDLDDAGRVGRADLGAAVLVHRAGPAVTELLGGILGLDALLIGVNRVLVGGGSRYASSGCVAAAAATCQPHQTSGQSSAR